MISSLILWSTRKNWEMLVVSLWWERDSWCLSVAKKHRCDFFVPVSSPVSAISDSKAKPLLEELGCRVLHFGLEECQGGNSIQHFLALVLAWKWAWYFILTMWHVYTTHFSTFSWCRESQAKTQMDFFKLKIKPNCFLLNCHPSEAGRQARIQPLGATAPTAVSRVVLSSNRGNRQEPQSATSG